MRQQASPSYSSTGGILHSQEKWTNRKTVLSGRRTTRSSLRNTFKVQRQAQQPGAEGNEVYF